MGKFSPRKKCERGNVDCERMYLLEKSTKIRGKASHFKENRGNRDISGRLELHFILFHYNCMK